jgi:Holliday junction resolvase
MTHYANGRSFEYKVMEDLSVSGWVSVRAAGSKGSTKADIVAIHPTRGIMFVQCKTNGIISAEEWNRLHEIAGWHENTKAVIAERPKRGKIAYWEITGERVPYKPAKNRIEYFPHQEIPAVTS